MLWKIERGVRVKRARGNLDEINHRRLKIFFRG